MSWVGGQFSQRGHDLSIRYTSLDQLGVWLYNSGSDEDQWWPIYRLTLNQWTNGPLYDATTKWAVSCVVYTGCVYYKFSPKDGMFVDRIRWTQGKWLLIEHNDLDDTMKYENIVVY